MHSIQFNIIKEIPSFKTGELWKVVNTNDIPGYTHVFKSHSGEYMYMNSPNGIVGKCYCDIIKLAEDIKNRPENRKVTINDLVRIINKNNSIEKSSHHATLYIKGLKLSDFSNNILHIYKFPVDNAYMVITADAPRSITFLTGEKEKKEVKETKNNDN